MHAVVGLLSRFLFGGLLAAVALLAVATIETAPRVPTPTPPEARDAEAVNLLLREVQAIRGAPGGRGTLVAEPVDIDGMFRLLHRAHPEIAGRARVEDDRLVIDTALALGAGGRFGWINLTAVVPPSTSSDTSRSPPPAVPCCSTFSSQTLGAHQRRRHHQPQLQRVGRSPPALDRWRRAGSPSATPR